MPYDAPSVTRGDSHFRVASALRALSLLGALSLGLQLATVRAAAAQVFQVQGGGSSLYDGYGGMLGFWTGRYEGWIGLGYLDGVRLGGSLKTAIGGDTLRVGDDALTLRYPTDLFTGGVSLLGQGIGYRRVGERTTLSAFGGASASGIAAPVFSAARSEEMLALLLLETRLSSRASLFSQGVVAARQSILQGIQWQSPLGYGAALTGGLGNGRPYATSSVNLRRAWIDAKAAYTWMGDGFRRAAVTLPVHSEVERENVVITVEPRPGLALTLGRQNFRQDSSDLSVASRASLNQLLARTTAGGFHLSGGLFDSRSEGTNTLSAFLTAGRELTRWVKADLSLLQTWIAGEAESTVPVLTVREFVTPRLSLLQLLTRSNGHTSVSFGGNYYSNLVTVGVDYQVLHTPFRRGNPFQQAMVLSLKLQLGNYQANVGTYVTPNGTVEYTAQGSTFLYAGDGTPEQPVAMGFKRYIIRGRVVDELGTPVEGAALDIGREIAFTNSQGEFFIRRGSTKPTQVKVLVDEFLTAGRFEAVSPAITVAAQLEDKATQIEIVVRRIRLPAPAVCGLQSEYDGNERLEVHGPALNGN